MLGIKNHACPLMILGIILLQEAVRLVMNFFGSVPFPASKAICASKVFIDFIRLINMYYYTTVFI